MPFSLRLTNSSFFDPCGAPALCCDSLAWEYLATSGWFPRLAQVTGAVAAVAARNKIREFDLVGAGGVRDVAKRQG